MVENLWHKHVPLKVMLFAWHMFSNHIPKKDNMLRCGILQADSTLCVGGCGLEESIDHLFFCVVTSSAVCGILYQIGLVFLRMILILQHTIFFFNLFR